MNIKLTKAIVVNGKMVPAGTVLPIADESIDFDKLPSDSFEIALESEASLTTKGTLAIRGLVMHIATVLTDLPTIDRPELIRILRIASMSVSGGSGKSFLKNLGKYTI